MTIFHLDKSVGLRALLGQSPSAAMWIDRTTANHEHTVVSSRILRTELTRVLRREGLSVALREEIPDVLSLVPVTLVQCRTPKDLAVVISAGDARGLRQRRGGSEMCGSRCWCNAAAPNRRSIVSVAPVEFLETQERGVSL